MGIVRGALMRVLPRSNVPNEDLVAYLRRQRRLLTTNEVARILGKHRETIYRMIHARQLPVVLDGARWKIDPAKLADWVDKRSLW